MIKKVINILVQKVKAIAAYSLKIEMGDSSRVIFNLPIMLDFLNKMERRVYGLWEHREKKLKEQLNPIENFEEKMIRSSSRMKYRQSLIISRNPWD